MHSGRLRAAFVSFQFTEEEVHGKVEPFMKLHLLAVSPTPNIAANDFVAFGCETNWTIVVAIPWYRSIPSFNRLVSALLA